MKPSVIFSAGFDEDLKLFVELFNKRKTTSFEHFKKCWRCIRFDGIFVGKTSIAELYECSEDYMQITTKYFFQQNSCKIFAVYLLYTLYYKQPVPNYAKVRLTLKQWNELKIFWSSLEAKNHAKLMIAKMYKEGAFKFVLTEREYALEVGYEKFHRNF